MSDNDSGDDMDDLQAILNDCAAKENPKNKEKPVKSEAKPDEPLEWIRSEEEIRLDKLIFGDKEGFVEKIKQSSSQPKDETTEFSTTKKRKPAWQDEDDELKTEGGRKRRGKPLNERLKTQFERIVSTPKWADLDRKEENEDSDEEILQTVGFISNAKSTALPSHDLNFKKMKDLNNKKEGPISSIQFHPTSTVAMVSGLNGIATLYSIDGQRNDKLHSIGFKKFPIYCAKILPCGTQAMFAGNTNFFYSYDLMQAAETRHLLPRKLFNMNNFEISPDGKYFAANGRGGELHLFDLKSKELIHTFKQEEFTRAIKFSLDSTKIISSSARSTISIFDIRQERVMHTFLDDGCIKGRSMALSPDGRMLATGSAEGAVNIYEYQKVLASQAPLPEKTFLNLTTSITRLNFNHSSEILGISSNVVRAAVRLAHFPTGTVFANFPPFNNNLRSVQQIEFSPSSGYMALGTAEKEAMLYRLKHYNNY
ncbi:U3 small nucleolar RNA-associated protein 18 homolog [Eupeodes corollae]|uniref:U3 small nucleolar RNA-associated protein 18 homolog n=1 Tax=Eupeodes corollae TaxID=290404 RepID=UPI00248FBC94|nr:U3 small nucleolar RNA-associated protein 18 homolog [Eupeodes corollae]